LDPLKSDPWARLAEESISNPVKSRMKAAATREQRRQEKAKAEGDILFKEWKTWHEQRKAELLAGPYGQDALQLLNFIEQMTLDDAARLIELIEASAIRSADRNTRRQILSLISRGIIYVREANGLDPFDDPLPDDDPDVFQRVKCLLI
jgi:hypothetical protein